MARNLKICLVASAGGHLTQLLKIAKCWEDYETFCVTTLKVVENELSTHGRVHVIGECNHKQPMRVMKVMAKCIKVVFCERPDVVMSTGAACGCVMCFLGKLLGAKVVWVDSITNVKRMSLSGRMVRHISDLFLVQWPELADQYRNVEYVGAVI